MTKDELLAELSAKVSAGEVSMDEVLIRFNVASQSPVVSPAKTDGLAKHLSATKLLYIIGAIIVVIGILAFVSQVWDALGSTGHIAITLGLGLVITAMGSALLKAKPEENIGPVFHAIGGMLIPGGAVVALSELHVDFASMWPVTATFGAIFIFYLLLVYVHKHAILTFFAVANGTVFIYLLVSALLGGSFYNNGDVYAYLTMVVGASYLLLGYSFRDGWNQKLIGVLYLFGSIAVLGAAFSRVFDSVLWQLLYFFIVAGGMLLAVYIRNKAILAISTLFLIAHISYITSKYFADSIGWPVSLVLLGFIFIGLGYASVNINKKYIAS